MVVATSVEVAALEVDVVLVKGVVIGVELVEPGIVELVVVEGPPEELVDTAVGTGLVVGIVPV